MKPQLLKINANFDSSGDNANYCVIISGSTSLIPLVAPNIRHLLTAHYCPQQRRQKLCLVAVRKSTFTQLLPFEIQSCIAKIIHFLLLWDSLVKGMTVSLKCVFFLHVHIPFPMLHRVEEIQMYLLTDVTAKIHYWGKYNFKTRVTSYIIPL